MSNKVELTELQIEEMNDILNTIGINIEKEQTFLKFALDSMGKVGNGTIDKGLYNLMKQKEKNLQLQYDTLEKYVRLWQDIVNKYTDIESNLIKDFKEGSIS